MIEEYIVKHESTEYGESIGYVQSLIRCKDCKHAQEGAMNEICCELLEGKDIYRSVNWFCADGEFK